MEADWDEIARIAVPPPALHGIPTPATAIAFDNQQELLWVGNDQVSRDDIRLPAPLLIA
jgi:PAB-dependent poly(A)-specific ribonuclease subunit 2